MGYVAFLCGNCKQPLRSEWPVTSTQVCCAGCGARLTCPESLAELPVATFYPEGSESPALPDSEPAATALMDLAALPETTDTHEKKAEISADFNNSGVLPVTTEINYSTPQLLRPNSTVPWLLLAALASFTVLSGALNVFLLMRLLAADEALRKRSHFVRKENEQRMAGINISAFISKIDNPPLP